MSLRYSALIHSFYLTQPSSTMLQSCLSSTHFSTSKSFDLNVSLLLIAVIQITEAESQLNKLIRVGDSMPPCRLPFFIKISFEVLPYAGTVALVFSSRSSPCNRMGFAGRCISFSITPTKRFGWLASSELFKPTRGLVFSCLFRQTRRELNTKPDPRTLHLFRNHIGSLSLSTDSQWQYQGPRLVHETCQCLAQLSHSSLVKNLVQSIIFWFTSSLERLAACPDTLGNSFDHLTMTSPTSFNYSAFISFSPILRNF